MPTLPDLDTVDIERSVAVPVSVISGFLGSGKTTLILDCLRLPTLANTAVIVNEFGEIGLDHVLVETATETTLLLDNGCLCCTWQNDLAETLLSLLARRERREVPHFTQVFVETSGLADPLPVLQTLLSDPLQLSVFELGSLVTVVDATWALSDLTGHVEAARQLSLSDRVILSKTDLVSETTAQRLCEDLAQKTAARVTAKTDLQFDKADFFARHTAVATDQDPSVHHSEGLHTWSQTLTAAMTWSMLDAWLEGLIEHFAEHLLRVKGIVRITGESNPMLVQMVRHRISRPVPLDDWPADGRGSRLIVIGTTETIRSIRPPQAAPVSSGLQ